MLVSFLLDVNMPAFDVVDQIVDSFGKFLISILLRGSPCICHKDLASSKHVP
ncbi:MAG: hypothetical protein NZ853_01230 [Leptospiraceae bacterium]|nr:hypothetical protein [Leptospiraceae bacterium]MDW7976150.1 hypothetical protein [Leptospiraceae bacterium]